MPGSRPDGGPERWFFVHVMKTGGTAAGHAVGTAYDTDRVYPPRREPAAKPDAVAKMKVRSLLALPATERARYDYFSVHMPAWVAEVAAPHHRRATVLREPVARTVSHLRHIARTIEGVSLEEIFADDAIRERLADYQTQLFSETEADFRAEQERRLDEWRRVFAGDAARRSGSTTPPTPSEGSRIGVAAGMATAIEAPRSCGRQELEAALRRLAGFDVVGVSDDMPAFRAAIQRFGPAIPEIGWRNRAPSDDHVVSDGLLASIREHTELDRELYATAGSWLTGAASPEEFR